MSNSKTKKTSTKDVKKPKPLKVAVKKAPENIYLDNNSHTLICPKAKEILFKWLEYYNPSSSNKLSKESKILVDRAIKFMHEQCGTTENTHQIIFTSGGSESKSTIIRSVVYAISKKQNKFVKPHIITSAIEHHNIIETLKDLENGNNCHVSYIKPNIYGCINPSDVEAEINRIKETGGNVALITIMFANNETGAINNIPSIGKIAEKYEIPLHTDAVQVFGKFIIDLPKNNINAISVSFHKLYGPGGIGLLVIDKSLIEGYEMTGLINGTQQDGFRGGTENVPSIAAAMEATKVTFQNRTSKNDKLLQMKMRIIEKLKKHYPFGNLIDYIIGSSDNEGESNESKIVETKNLELEEIKLNGDKVGGEKTPLIEERKPIELVIIGPPLEKKNSCLPNTLLLAVAKTTGEKFCNITFKHALERNNVIISIASACLTSMPNASHVLTAMDLPSVLKRGVIRISLGDENTMQECDKFADIFLSVLDSILKTMDRANKGPSIGAV